MSFISPQICIFPSLLQGSAYSGLGKTGGREAHGPHGHCSLFLGSSSERGVMRILTVIILVPFTLWSSGLTPGKGQHHLYICDHATAFSNHLSIKFGGFPTHVARKKLSQFSSWRWSNLFLNQARMRYPYHFLRDKISRSYDLCFFHLMCEV